MMVERVLFDEQIAPHYEAWYGTPEGRRADTLEKASLRRLLCHSRDPTGEHPSQSAAVVGLGCQSRGL